MCANMYAECDLTKQKTILMYVIFVQKCNENCLLFLVDDSIEFVDRYFTR